MILKLNVKEALRFFDEAPEESKHHSSAVVGVIGEDLGIALLQKHLTKIGIKTEILVDKSDRPLVPICLKKDGKRQLDRWLFDKTKNRLYQVEIKNWSAHSKYGTRVTSSCINEEYQKQIWERRWDDKSKRFKDHSSRFPSF